MNGVKRWIFEKREINMYKESEVVGIAILCNDPRANLWKPTKAQLIPEGKIFAPIMVFGGAVSLAYPDELPADHHHLLSQIHFGKGVFTATREILVVTHDCRYYNRIPRKFTLEDKIADAAKIAIFLQQHFSMPTTAYFAHAKSETKIEFEKIQ